MKKIILPNLSETESENIIPDNTILLGYAGSISHGTFVPSTDPNSIDDIDIMGICIAPLNCYFGLHNFEHKVIQYKEWDSTIYEIRKYFNLLLKQNPNVLSLLWLNDHNYIYKSEIGQLIIDNRRLFSSKRAYHSFNGYAYAQLKRMTHFKFEGYMGAKRKGLVEKYGYDCKNAAHLIRLQKMCLEYLGDGELHVFRHDAEQLLEIKRGEWTLEQVQTEADRLFKLIEEAYVRTPLPHSPDYNKIEDLLMNILQTFYKENQ